jgi:hypothetical protein
VCKSALHLPLDLSAFGLVAGQIVQCGGRGLRGGTLHGQVERAAIEGVIQPLTTVLQTLDPDGAFAPGG